MNRPFSTGMSVLSAIRRADVFSRGPTSSDAVSADARIAASRGTRPQNVACTRASSSTIRRRVVLAQRVQRVGELARVDREVLEHQHEAAGKCVERRSVRLGHAGQFRRQLAVEAGFGFGEPAQFAHQAGGQRFAGHLDEHRLRNAVTGQRQPGSRRRARVAADDRNRRDGASHDLRERICVEIRDGAGQRSNAADDRVSGDTLDTAAQMRRQADDRRNPIHVVSLQIRRRFVNRFGKDVPWPDRWRASRSSNSGYGSRVQRPAGYSPTGVRTSSRSSRRRAIRRGCSAACSASTTG